MDRNSLAHTKWNCKYHIVFAPKYRRQIIYSKIKADIGKIIRTLCKHKGVEIIEASACKDHIHIVGKYSTQNKCFSVNGVSKRKKFINDI